MKPCGVCGAFKICHCRDEVIDFKSNKKYQEAVQFRDWQTCDLICEEHKELVSQIDELKKQNEKIVKLLKTAIDSCQYGDFHGEVEEEWIEKAKQLLNKEKE